MSDVAISVKSISKYFVLPHQKANTIKSFFVNPFKRYDTERQTAFENISFDIKKGEFFGIVGRNGSGKSTLLKCIAGVYVPDIGEIKVNGKLIPFIELGVGFNPELSGRDNVYLNGALLGFSRKEITKMYDKIVEFSELERFMDQKLKNYSSGMQVRLAFSIAIQTKGDVLLLDEVLAVGDAAFQEKCQEFFSSQKGKRTIILVTHDMSAVEKYCNRAMLIDNGRVVKIGSSDEIALMYRDMFIQEKDAKTEKNNANVIKKLKKDIVKLERVELYQSGSKVVKLEALKPFKLKIRLHSDKHYEKTILGINLLDSRNNILLATSTKKLEPTTRLSAGSTDIIFDIQNIFTDGDYVVNIALSDETSNGRLLMHVPNAFSFSIRGIKMAKHSLTHPNVSVTIE